MKLDFKGGRTALGDSSQSVPQPEKALVHSPESGEPRVIERRAEDERLRQSETLYHSLVASLPQCIMRKDRAGRFIFVNQRFAEMLHASAEQVLGRTDFDFYPAEMARKFRADDQRVMATGELLETIEENLSANGVVRDVHVLKIPVRDWAGDIVGIQCVFWDVTASRQAQREIQRRDELLQAIMDHTPAVIYMKDLEGRYLYINREYEKLFNVQREQTIAKTDLDIFPAEYAQKFQANDRAIIAAGRPRTVDEKVPHGDEPHDYLSVKFPVLDSAGKPYALCGISTDITGRKQMETQLAERNRELRNVLAELQDARMHLIQTEKLKAVGTLAAGIAHEVKNPLQTILLGLSGLTQTLGTTCPETEERLQGMREAINRANQIVRDLLDYARPDPLQLVRLDLNELVRDVLRLMNYTLHEARVAVVFHEETRLPRLALDRQKMQQVLMNLLTNSVQAMEQLPADRRRVEIHVGREPLLSLGSARGVGDTTCWLPGDDLVVVELSDRGTGIPAHLLGRVFDPFFTTKAPGRGTGLGLHIVQNIIALHGGTIEIGNRPEGGARVRIVLNPKKGRTHHEKKPHPRR
jgi:two-component system, NtrC family, sensor kinase